MFSLDKTMQERRSNVRKSVNVVDLVNKAKFEAKREKRRDLVIAVAVVSALAMSGFIISL